MHVLLTTTLNQLSTKNMDLWLTEWGYWVRSLSLRSLCFGSYKSDTASMSSKRKAVSGRESPSVKAEIVGITCTDCKIFKRYMWLYWWKSAFTQYVTAAKEQGTLEVKEGDEKRSHTDLGRGNGRGDPDLRGMGLSPSQSFLVLPLWNPGHLVLVEGAEEGFINSLLKCHPFVVGNFGLMEIGPFLLSLAIENLTYSYFAFPSPTSYRYPFVVGTVTWFQCMKSLSAHREGPRGVLGFAVGFRASPCSIASGLGAVAKLLQCLLWCGFSFCHLDSFS